MINLWLREQDRSLLDEHYKANLNPYCDNLLFGSLDNPGFLGRIGKNFVLGKDGIWKPKDTSQEYHFVRIDNNSAYPSGLILTPYSAIDVDCHLKSKTIDKTTKFERVELNGSDTEDFILRVFVAYDGPLVSKFNEKDRHLLFYSTHERP